MERLLEHRMAVFEGGDSKNCGTTAQTAFILSGCSFAGGLIGAALGSFAAAWTGTFGSAAGSFFCHYICYHAGS